jgi:hypothetical protein
MIRSTNDQSMEDVTDGSDTMLEQGDPGDPKGGRHSRSNRPDPPPTIRTE